MTAENGKTGPTAEVELFGDSKNKKLMKMNHWRQSGIPPTGYTIEPADGRWSWAVLIGCCISAMTVSNAFVSFGVLLTDLRIIFAGSSVSTLTLAPSIAISLSSFTGPLATILMTKYSCRTTVIIGGLMMSIGFSLLCFINSIEMLLAVYGIFIGMGSGLGYPSFPVIVSQYFKKHYGIAMGLVMAGTGMAKFLLAPFTELMREKYGCRGALLILGAVSMHCCVGASFFQPAKWHNVLVATFDDDYTDTSNANTVDNNPDSKGNGTGNNTGNGTGNNTGNGNFTLNIDNKNKIELKSEKRFKFGNFLKTIDYSLLKWPVFYVGTINNVIMMMSLTFSGIFMYPLGLDVGLEPMQSAMAMSFRAFGEISGRAFSPMVRAYFDLSSRWCTIVIFTLHGILCIVLINATSMTYFMTVGIISGVVFGSCVGLNGLLVMENIGRKRLPSFLGLAALIQGLAMLPIGPFLGWIRDTTGTYRNVFLVIGAFQFVMAAAWLIRPYLPDDDDIETKTATTTSK